MIEELLGHYALDVFGSIQKCPNGIGINGLTTLYPPEVVEEAINILFDYKLIERCIGNESEKVFYRQTKDAEVQLLLNNDLMELGLIDPYPRIPESLLTELQDRNYP